MRAPSFRRTRRHPAPGADGRFTRLLAADVLEDRTLLSVITPFAPRFTTNATGDVAIVGNTAMTAPASDPAAVNARNGVGSKVNNNDFNMAFVDVDSDPTTFDSSSATLSLPSGASVLFAGLYWGGRNPQNASLRAQVKLSTPASGGYLTLNGALVGTSTTSDGSDYQSFVNVTSQVAAAGSGTYTAANVQASTGTNTYAGWALVVAYQAPGLPARNLTVFDGYASVNIGEGAVTGSISGFVTPPTGTVNAKVGVVAYEGDLGFTGDSMSLDGNALSDAVNPSNNFFNSTISNLGTRVTAKTPNSINQLGFDAKIVDASGFVPNGATGATFQLQTTQDQYFPGVVTTAINLYAPQVVSTKTATDLTNASGPVQPGDLVQYAMTVSNSGQDGANNVVLTDPIPANMQYVPGTLVVASGANAGAKTDAAGDDQAQFNAGSNNVVFRLGTGANATTGGSLAIGASTVVTFQVRVNANTPDQTTVTNQATIAAVGATSGFPLTVLSSAASFLVHPLADLSLTKTVNNPAPNVGGPVTFTLNLANLGPSPATNAQVTDLLPSGLTFVSATPSQGTYNATTGLWTAGTITTAAPQTLVITATVASPAAQTNTATITHADQSDPNAGNNIASATETPQQANLVLSKTVSNATPNVGSTVSFTVSLKNMGPNTATDVQVTDPLPAGLTFVSATASQGTYNGATGVWSAGTVDVAGGVRSLVINATVASPAAQTNTATITHSDQFDPNTANTVATATETPQQADLVLSKTVDNPTPNLGATVNFTITLADSGPAPATNVQVTDVLPSSYQFVAAFPSQGTYNAATGLWTVGTVDTTAPRSLRIQATVIAPTSSVNTATITHTDQFDPITANNTASAATSPQQADLSVTKAVSNPAPNVGDTITYTVRLTDNGPSAATGVTLRDSLPTGLTFVAAAPGQGTYDPATGIWTVGGLANGSSAVLTVSALVVSPNPSTNTATIIHADQADPNPGNNAAPAVVTPQQADLVLDKTVSNPTPNVGDSITYTVTVRDDGPNDATGVAVQDILPAGLTFVAASPSQGNYNSGTGTWTVGNVGLSTAQTLAIRAIVAGPSSSSNTATISHADQYDPDPANNSAAAALTPQQADLALSKAVSDPAPNVGDTVTYTITLTGNGPDPATGVRVSDLLPAGVSFVSAVPSQGTYNSTTGLWTAATVSASAPATLVLSGTVNSPNPVTNTATISHADQFDPDPANNTATAALAPQQADLALSKAVSDPAPNVGDTVTYTVTLTGNGPDPATGVQVSDLLPAGVSFVSAVPSRGTYDSTTGLWSVGTVTTPSSQTLVIRALVVSPSPQTNTATISHSDQFDPVPANRSAGVLETPQLANLNLVKTVDDPAPNVGDTITFTVTLSNVGPNAATNVVVTDLLPEGLGFVASAPSLGTYDPTTGLWNVGTVATSTPQTLTLEATVLGPAALRNLLPIPTSDGFAAPLTVGPETNTATITHSDQFDPNPGNTTASATETPQQADLVLSKTVDDPAPNVGATITYTVTLSDNGPDSATDVVVADPLPSGLFFLGATANAGVYDPLSGLWTVGTVATTRPESLRIRAMVTAPTTAVNMATISHADQFDPNPANNTATTSDVPQQADLSVTKAVSDPAPDVGGAITYTITLTDNGPDAATGVIVQDVLPAGVGFVSAVPGQGLYDPATGVWTAGDLANGSSTTLIIHATVLGASPSTNTVMISHSDQFDPNPANNTASTTVTPRQADLFVTKSVSNPTPNVGDTVTFIVTVGDNGPNDATGVAVQDILPAGLTFVSATVTAGSYDATSGAWDVGGVMTSAAQVLTIRATVTSPSPTVNTATISGADQFDPVSANNAARVSLTPQQADLALTKSVSTSTPNLGDVVSYLVVLTDNGPNGATDVQVTDALPAGLTFVAAIPSQGSYSPGTGLWSVGTVNVGSPVTLAIRAIVTSPNPQTNTATITHADQFDPIPSNNTATATLTPQRADLALTKSVDNPTPKIGNTVTYTVTLTDNGPDSATNVNLSDVLPAGLNPVSARTTVGSYNPLTGLWKVGTVAQGTPQTLQVVALVAGPAATTNTATITHADQYDPDPANNTASSLVTPQQAELSLTKSVSDPTPNVGETITYIISLTDSGPDGATGVQVQDALPAGLAFVSAIASPGTTYKSASGLWSVGTVNVGSPVTLAIRATVTSPNPQTNTATIGHADQFDPITSNNTATATLTPQQADLALAKTVDNPTPNVGDTVTFTVSLGNNGPDAATGAQVTDLLPAGLTFVSDTTSQGTYDPATGLWDVGTVAVGAAQVLTIRAMVTSPSPVTNTATISHADQFDPDPGNNNAAAPDSPQQADLALSKTVDDAMPNVGDLITYTVDVRDLGPSDATNVLISDPLPAGLALVSALPSQGSYDAASGVWTVGIVTVAAPQSLQITARVTSAGAATNTARITHSDQFDPNPGNDGASVVATPQQADLGLSKTVSNTTPNVGDAISYTITLSNAGPDGATGVRVTDLLPAGVTFVSATPSQGAYVPGTGIWTVGAVNAGSPQTLVIQATVTSPGPQTNAATITHADQFDPVTTNNTTSVETTPQQSDLALAKSVSDATPNVGDTISYSVTLTNIGPAAATGVRVTDLLPAGLAFVSAAPSQGTYDPAPGLWTVGAVGTRPQTLIIRATVTSPDPQTNAAAITHADQFDPDTANNTASATQTPQRADLALAKTVNNAAPNVGATISYTVTLSNKGPDAATAAQVTDLLPAGVMFVSAAPSQGTYNSVSGLWAVGSVTTSAPQTLVLTATVVAAGQIINTATITHANQFDPDPSNNSASAPETAEEVDLALAKTVDDPRPNVGETITYTITLSNLGPNTATGVQVRDRLPRGVTFVSAAPSQGVYNSATGAWTVGIVTESVMPTLRVTAIVVSPKPQINTASIIHSDQFIPNPENSTARSTLTPQQAHLALAKTVNDPTPNVGEIITYTLTLTNSGPDAATNVQTTDRLPAGLTFVSATPSQGTYSGATGVWTVGTVTTSSLQTLRIQARLVRPGTQANIATITHSDQFDPSSSDNTDGVALLPQQADLVLAKAVSNPTPNVGDTIAYTVALTNIGPDAATNVRVTDLLPAGVTFVSAMPSRGTYVATTGLWTVGTVDVGAPQTLVIRARIGSPRRSTNTATISHADQFDPAPASNTARAVATPQQADLVLAKAVSNPTPNVGDTIRYTITLTDKGPDAATNVRVTDRLPAGLSFVSAVPSQGRYNPGTGLWTAGTVDVGAPQTLVIRARIGSPRRSTNTATISHADQFDPAPASNTARAVATPQQADLALAKAVNDTTPRVG